MSIFVAKSGWGLFLLDSSNFRQIVVRQIVLPQRVVPQRVVPQKVVNRELCGRESCRRELCTESYTTEGFAQRVVHGELCTESCATEVVPQGRAAATTTATHDHMGPVLATSLPAPKSNIFPFGGIPYFNLGT